MDHLHAKSVSLPLCYSPLAGLKLLIAMVTPLRCTRASVHSKGRGRDGGGLLRALPEWRRILPIKLASENVGLQLEFYCFRIAASLKLVNFFFFLVNVDDWPHPPIYRERGKSWVILSLSFSPVVCVVIQRHPRKYVPDVFKNLQLIFHTLYIIIPSVVFSFS